MSRHEFGQREHFRAHNERIFVNKIFGEGDKMVIRSSADPSPGGGQNSISMRGEIFLCCFHIVTLFLGDKIDTRDCRTGYYNGSVTGDFGELSLIFPFGRILRIPQV